MKLVIWSALLAAVAFAQPKGPAGPPLLDCGVHGDAEILCGTRSPEDLELTPDGKQLIVSQFVTRGPGGGIVLFDPQTKTFRKIEIRAEGRRGWGDPTCPGPIADMLAPHGTSLRKRANGVIEYFVVNHGGRESIEMYELTGPDWSLTWRGCVLSTQPYNDVAALADGGFFATHPTALQTPGMDLFTGQPSGYVVRWSPGEGEKELPGTRFGYPNGVVASDDGRWIYYNAWTAREVHKYDTKEGKEAQVLKLDFMPDNLTWTKKGRLLAAGVKGTRGDCPAGSGTPCGQGFGIAEIDTSTMTSKIVFDSQGKGALISGVSVALEMGDSIYIGSFQGERIVKIGYKP
jgi:hypothetical protein